MRKDPVLLIIGYVWPEPNSSAAGGRMMVLIHFFKRLGYRVYFASAAQESEFAFDLDTIGVEKVHIQLNHSSFDAFIKKLQPNLVLFDRFMIEEQFGWRVYENCPDAMRLLDTEDLHFLREARQHALKNGELELQNDKAKREIASILRCDLSLIVSEFEMQLLQNEFGISTQLLCYFPLFVNAQNHLFDMPLPDFAQRKDFVFIGNFWHEPNWQAVLYLKEKIWPLLRKNLPEATMHIYGAYPSEKVFNLQNTKEKFLVHGRAENAFVVVSQMRVSLAPLLFGAGLKGKLLEAMYCGTPSVTTQIGAEGIAAANDWPGFVATTPEEITVAAFQLYTDEALWNQKQSIGFQLLEARFSQEFFEVKLETEMQQLLENLPAHRRSNFIGSILQHQSMASTKYMSKWIEEKGETRSEKRETSLGN